MTTCPLRHGDAVPPLPKGEAKALLLGELSAKLTERFLQ